MTVFLICNRILVPLFIMMLSVAISSSRPIYNYHSQSRRLYDHHTGYNNYDYDYYDYTDNHHAASSQQRQIQLDTFADLNIAERVSGALATLSIIGLSYLSSRSRTADLQLQINSLTNSVTSLQNSIYSLQSQISTLSSTSASSSSVSSAVLESTCTTLRSITQLSGNVATTRDISTYLRSLILIDDPVCS